CPGPGRGPLAAGILSPRRSVRAAALARRADRAAQDALPDPRRGWPPPCPPRARPRPPPLAPPPAPPAPRRPPGGAPARRRPRRRPADPPGATGRRGLTPLLSS